MLLTSSGKSPLRNYKTSVIVQFLIFVLSIVFFQNVIVDMFAVLNRAETVLKRCALKGAARNCRDYLHRTFMVRVMAALLKQMAQKRKRIRTCSESSELIFHR